jgi:tetratricopeptide (TPR) repeat protein
MGLAAVVLVILGLAGKLPGWKVGLLLVVVAIAGFSVHTYIPIRSAEEPILNENNPSESWDATIGYLERKQYLRESMTERMFKRRSEWTNAFGMQRRMGFWGFFSQQYGFSGVKFVIPFLIGLFGLWEVVRRRAKLGLPVLLLLLLSSIGLVLYMNFADGTRMTAVGGDYLEVRDRDYFFTPAFILFGIAIGFGLTALAQMVGDVAKKLSSPLKTGLMALTLVLFASPIFALTNNWFYADRSNNWIAYDYATNLLQAADENAIVFTSGDNDTFPVWCLQYTYGMRPDVTIVNLALANTHWYIEQIQSSMGVDLGMSEEQIKQLRSVRYPDGRVRRPSHAIVDAILARHMGKRPIQFSVTTGQSARQYRGKPIDSLCELTGLMWRVTPEAKGQRTSVEEAVGYFYDSTRFRIRTYNDTTVHKTETGLHTSNNYGIAMLIVADTLRRRGDAVGAERLARRILDLIPQSRDAENFLGSLYGQQGRVSELRRLIDDSRYGDKRSLSMLLVRSHFTHLQDENGLQVLRAILDGDPSYRPAFEELLRNLVRLKRYSDAVSELKRWIANNPGDTRSEQLLRQIEADMAQSQRDGE